MISILGFIYLDFNFFCSAFGIFYDRCLAKIFQPIGIALVTVSDTREASTDVVLICLSRVFVLFMCVDAWIAAKVVLEGGNAAKKKSVFV